MFLEHTYHCNVVYCYTVMQIYVQVYSVMPVRDELEKCEYLCSEASLSLLPEYHCRKLIFIINYYYYYCYCYKSIPFFQNTIAGN